MKPIPPPRQSAQRGAALVIGLVLLAVASMVTITSLNTGMMQERMAANQDNHARSFMAAEAGGARLVEFVSNGWPTADRFPSEALTRVVLNDPSITYTITRHANPPPPWTTSPLAFEVVGHARTPDGSTPDGSTVLAQTRLLVELERIQSGVTTPPQAPPPSGTPPAPSPLNAPAAASCFGGPCIIRAGSGGGSNLGFGTVSGFNHPIPRLDCSGGNCRTRPEGADQTMPAVPAVFLTHEAGSDVVVQGGGGGRPPFQGLDRAGTGIIRTNNINAAHFPSHYPNKPDGTSTVPTLASVIGPPTEPPTTRLEGGGTSLTGLDGSRAEVGIWVIDGRSATMVGNSMFVGLVVIRNCGTLSVQGNPNIYGAVIVDATGCGQNYRPIAGSGTPAIRYSRIALQRAHDLVVPPPSTTPPPGAEPGPGPGFSVVRWMEIIQ